MEILGDGFSSREISELVRTAKADQFEATVKGKLVFLADPISTLAGKIYKVTYQPRVLVNSIIKGRDPISNMINRMKPQQRTEVRGFLKGVLWATIAVGSAAAAVKVEKYHQSKKTK